MIRCIVVPLVRVSLLVGSDFIALEIANTEPSSVSGQNEKDKQRTGKK